MTGRRVYQNSFGQPIGFLDNWDESRAYEFWVDPSGERRTKVQYPYTFDDYFLWRLEPKNAPGVNGVYSDRMVMWDEIAWKAAVATLPPNASLLGAGPEEIDKFLTTYFKKPVQAIAFAEGCNQSSGYTYFIFWYRDLTAVYTVEKTRGAYGVFRDGIQMIDMRTGNTKRSCIEFIKQCKPDWVAPKPEKVKKNV